MNDIEWVLKPEVNKINTIRNTDPVIGGTINDIVDFIVAEDYRRATQAAAYLLVFVARRASMKPFTALQAAFKVA